MTEPAAPPPSPGPTATGLASAPWALALCEVLLIVLVFFTAGGDPPPHRNEAHYLARLKHFWVEPYCPGDLFLESPDAHFTVVWLMGWLTRSLSLEAVAWIGRGLSWALIAWGWRRLSWRLAPWPLAAPLGAALWVVLTEQLHFAGEWAIGGFEAKTLAYGLVLLALADAADKRWNRAWVLLGGAAALHALVGAWSVVALGIAWGATGRRPSVGSMAPGLVTGGLLSLMGVLPALALNAGAPAETVVEANQVYVFERLPHHLAPLTKEVGWLVNRLGRHLVLLAALALLHRNTLGSASRPGPMRLCVWFAWGAAGAAACGLLIELVGWYDPAWSAGLLKYYWFRLSDIAAPVAVAMLVADWIGRRLARRSETGAYAAVLCVALCVWHVGGYAVRRAAAPKPPADSAMVDQAAWVEMCRWVRENTPEGTLFLVPRRTHSFKWRTGRAEVVTYKDVPQDAVSMVEWRRRYRDVFQIGVWPESGEPRWARSIGALGATRLRELADAYGASFALSQASSDWPYRYRASLPVLHREGPYTLYDLRRAP